MEESLTIEKLWELCKFKPNDKQEEAIKHSEGPLFLAAGPGAGKTRVLLWRTVNLIVFKEVSPDEIFLSTFTEKAAKQLKDGLHSLLNLVTSINGKQYDISRMYIGTVHSLCQRIISERRITKERTRERAPIVLDELDQYFYFSDNRFWESLLNSGGFSKDQSSYSKINKYISGRATSSKHDSIKNCIAIFNRFSEERLNPSKLSLKEDDDPILYSIVQMYRYYRESLKGDGPTTKVDFSLLQQAAYDKLELTDKVNIFFRYIIVDEYQDTNTIQEKIFFNLASGHANLCVVGDDDQALYRFRGATVENFVQFKQRFDLLIDTSEVKRIDLAINYRSTPSIVDFSTKYLNQTHWQDEEDSNRYYRIHDKNIVPGRSEDLEHISLVKSNSGKPQEVCEEIVNFVKKLKDERKIEDYSQCAFLFPSVKGNSKVQAFIDAFEKEGIPVYAPRATRFLEIEESSYIWGLFTLIFGSPKLGHEARGGDYQAFREWLKQIESMAKELCNQDETLKSYVTKRRGEIKRVLEDYEKLFQKVISLGLRLEENIDFSSLEKLSDTVGLSNYAQKNITNKAFVNSLRRKLSSGESCSVKYVLNRATSLDWTVLDIFYQITGFDYFKEKFKLAENGDEGPICNLALVSQYLARFIDKYSTVITAPFLESGKFSRTFFASYTYALFRLGESEYEDKEDPFPKGRIPFLTIHQSKGLEFPVVVLGSLYKVINSKPDPKEDIMYRLLPEKKDGEPLEKLSVFDASRVFYVGITRAQNLLVLPHFKGQGQAMNQGFKNLFASEQIYKIEDYSFDSLPINKFVTQDIGKAYSYTGDFISYKKCPRQYMTFRRLGFVPSRSQTMFFGSLVHQTIEDLHHYLISLREKSQSSENGR